MTLKNLCDELDEFLCDVKRYTDPVRCGNCIHSRYLSEVYQFRCELLRNERNERKLVDTNDYCSWGISGEEDEE